MVQYAIAFDDEVIVLHPLAPVVSGGFKWLSYLAKLGTLNGLPYQLSRDHVRVH